jgi:radical SAM protein with 4Fe4S-binding SPASM domain
MGELLFRKVVSELDSDTNVSLHYAGESLLHPKFAEYARLARDKFGSIGLSTNGSLLNKENRQVILDTVNSFTISLEGFAKTTNKVRVGADYDLITRNIELLVEERGNNKSPKIVINVTESNQSQSELLKFARHWTRKVDLVRSSLKVNSDLTLSNRWIDRPLKRLRVCRQPFRYLAVLWNGDVVPCCADWNGINVMGNVAHDSVSKVWNNLRFNRLRLSFLSRSLWSLCKNCGMTMLFQRETYRVGDLQVKLIDRHREYTIIS